MLGWIGWGLGGVKYRASYVAKILVKQSWCCMEKASVLYGEYAAGLLMQMQLVI